MSPTQINHYRILLKWLSPGRVLELDGINYGLSQDNELLHLMNEDQGVVVDHVQSIRNILDKIPQEKYTLMIAENTLTEHNASVRDSGR